MASLLIGVVVVVVLLALGYIYVSSSSAGDIVNKIPLKNPIENFENVGGQVEQVMEAPQVTNMIAPTQTMGEINASENIQFIEQPQNLQMMNNGAQLNQLPSECYPKDVLSSADLLPRDSNSLWAQVNPSGQGSLADQNFLTAGFHIGINTVGQTLRNPNKQLRSEIPNPQVKVSPWNQTTIEPDINRRPLEISGEI